MSSKRKSLPTTGRGSIANFFKPATQESKTSQAPPALKSPCKLQGLNRKQPLQPQELNTPLQPPSCASGQKRMPSPANAPSNKKQKGRTSPRPGSAPAVPVGATLKVFWKDDDAWYKGRVTRFDGLKHHIEYEDGELELLTLADERYELATPGSSGARRPAKRSRGAGSRVLLSESDGEADNVSVQAASESGSDFSLGNSKVPESSDDEEVALESETPHSSQGKGRPAGADASASEDDTGAPTAKRRKSQGHSQKVGKQPGKRSSSKRSQATSAGSMPQAVDIDLDAPEHAAPPNPKAQPGAKGILGGAGQVSSNARSESGSLKAAMAAEQERFASRAAERFPFLHPSKIKDAALQRPGDPGFNPRTLHIPKDWFIKAKVSEGQKQWWDFKRQNWDAVMLFKMGKFYEMFEMDAHTGCEVLGLTYMRGEQPHCGFPEAMYHQNAERLVRAGLRVVVIEQTETPDQLKARNDNRQKAEKKVNVVERQLVAVLTTGTLTDAEMLSGHPDASYLLALIEHPLPSHGPGPGSTSKDADLPVTRMAAAPVCRTQAEVAVDASAAAADVACAPKSSSPAADAGTDAQVMIGACFIDVATSRILIGQWIDDGARSHLRLHLSSTMPVELVLPAQGLSRATSKLLRGILKNPRINNQDKSQQFWDPSIALERAQQGSPGASQPAILQRLAGDVRGNAAALSAFGGSLSFLQEALLDRNILKAGRFELLPGSAVADASSVDNSGPQGSSDQLAAHLRVDGAALDNLEVLENESGRKAGTLLGALDRCMTPGGRRLLRAWLLRPLLKMADIIARQDAVAALMGPVSQAASDARAAFSEVGDLERSIARLQAAGTGRDADNVVLYEDAAKRRVTALASVLQGLQSLQEALRLLERASQQTGSQVLQSLVTPGTRFPDMQQQLQHLTDATDWSAACASGQIIPAQGVDAAFDEAEAEIKSAEKALKAYLKEVCTKLEAGNDITYISLQKESHLLEIPQEFAKRVPSSYELIAQRKGFNRYMTSRLRELVTSHKSALEARERAASCILQGLVKRFIEQQAVWQAAAQAMAELDVLMAFAEAARGTGEGPMCRPSFLPENADPILKAQALRHPAEVGAMQGRSFVPNDICLGGPCPSFVLLTGPNMGGKSTLLRQVCLAALMAQAGAWVPATSLELTPVDAVFVRMGARDAILLGHSTFFVELSETAAALNRATSRSLVAMDELGRGTSTSDGASIAAAVLQHLTSVTRCRGLFATHYHSIANVPGTSSCHMACAVEPAKDGQPEQVTFLYKLAQGACPRSYGVNVARLAGLPESVLQRATSFASGREAVLKASYGKLVSSRPDQQPANLHFSSKSQPALFHGPFEARGSRLLLLLGSDSLKSSHAHQGSNAVNHQDSESASTSPRQLDAMRAAAAETTSSPASQPEVMLAGSRRRALADLQSQAEAGHSFHGSRRQQQGSQADRHGHCTTRSTPASNNLARVGKRKGRSKHSIMAKHPGLVGRIVDVPADVFSVDIPDMYYRGIIRKRDYAHKDSFEVKFLEDGSRYWLPISDCQQWLEQMEARGRSETSQTVGAASDNFAASILAGFHGSYASDCSHNAWKASATAQHHSRAKRQRLTRSSSEPDISNLQRLASAV
ncbi:hypothetical protein WJX74_002610 [Apatococcus lobatus]|uniref:DNA mismatch repair protein n=1 Tax=Apatococcus lobatus TaxID=904363 RepID=A0AAW1SF01_9CHLO